MRVLLFSFVVLLAAACDNVRVAGGKDGKDGVTRTSKAARVIKGMEDNAFTADYLEASARVKLESEKLNIGGSATIRLHRDEAIWMSVRKFGFEGARALIRPDSFFFQNRLSGDYEARPLSYIEDKYKIPARFDLLQEIVLGNAVFFTRDLEMETSGEQYTLSGQDGRFATQHTVDARGFKLLEMVLNELAQNRTLTIQNGDFRKPEGRTGEFPFDRTVSIDTKATGAAKMEMEFRSLDFDGPFAMPFQRR